MYFRLDDPISCCTNKPGISASLDIKREQKYKDQDHFSLFFIIWRSIWKNLPFSLGLRSFFISYIEFKFLEKTNWQWQTFSFKSWLLLLPWAIISASLLQTFKLENFLVFIALDDSSYFRFLSTDVSNGKNIQIN